MKLWSYEICELRTGIFGTRSWKVVNHSESVILAMQKDLFCNCLFQRLVNNFSISKLKVRSDCILNSWRTSLGNKMANGKELLNWATLTSIYGVNKKLKSSLYDVPPSSRFYVAILPIFQTFSTDVILDVVKLWRRKYFQLRPVFDGGGEVVH